MGFVPAEVIERKKEITAETIRAEQNAKVRRVIRSLYIELEGERKPMQAPSCSRPVRIWPRLLLQRPTENLTRTARFR